ncbi:MAG: NADH-quinone oxidoreductase subunit NuoF [Bacillota bacterium]
MTDREILICFGTACLSSGAKDIAERLQLGLRERGLQDEYPMKKAIKTTGCVGPCSLGPMMIIMPEGTMYGHLTPDDVDRIIDEHLIGGEPVASLAVQDDSHHAVADFHKIDFLAKQTKIVLRDTGFVDPLNIDDYLEREGFDALKTALTEMEPSEVIEEIKASGLRGRGGAGFPTGLKWEFTRKAEGTPKYVICNADEGDPGAFMDRSILEGNPQSVIEAMTIAGYAIGSNRGFVYVRAEYPVAIQNLTAALDQARQRGFLGEDIFGTGFSFDIEIRVGAGAFVCGEETALIASIEGHRGQPRSRPPYPAQSGLWGKPTVINNVETLANVAPIIRRGSEWFSSIGTETSKGTKVFAVAGDVARTGLVEVPMGMTLREIIFDIAGGIPDGKELKAVQIGGPSGGTIPAKYLDTGVDYESLKSLGAIVGSGGMVIMDESSCMVDVARFFLEFTQEESCGKCTPCRIGTKRMLEILERITRGEGEPGDIEKLESFGKMIKATSLCGLGQTAPNPVLSTIQHFRDEYEAHIFDHRCPSRHCAALASYRIDPDVCVGCGTCIDECPVEAISGSLREPHVIDEEACIACGACAAACPVDAIS